MSVSNRLDGERMNYERELEEEFEEEERLFQIDERRFGEIISTMNNLSNAIHDLAAATVSQRPPVVVNLIASNDEDLKKFATIFAQGIK